MPAVTLTQSFLNDLPSTVDPCGENGEFHTFVYASPVFKNPIPVETGEIVERDNFVFADVVSTDGVSTRRRVTTSAR